MDIRRFVSFLALSAVAIVSFGGASSAQLNYRNPVVLAIAPDTVDCDDPDDPDAVEDVTISGICFRDSIVSGFLATNADGTGMRVDLGTVVNIGNNTVATTVPIGQLQTGVPYYVFLVRADGKRSTSYPNAFGYDVTFTCSAAVIVNGGPTLTSCRVVRTSTGRLVLQVSGTGFVVNDTIVLLNGQPCRKSKYPSRFVNASDGTTTRINCSGALDQLLPAVVTTRNQSSGATSNNSLNCDR